MNANEVTIVLRKPKRETIALIVLSIAAISCQLIAGGDNHHIAAIIYYICKPLATLVIVRSCKHSYETQQDQITRFIYYGMVMSLIGDVLLMLPFDLFLFGLIAFLIAHMCYIYAFTRDTQLYDSKAGVMAYLLIGAVVYWWLFPALDEILRYAVGAYVIVLATMASQMYARWANVGFPAFGWGALGGLLFVISDATLGIDKFVAPVPAASLWVLSTYWMAQYLISKSIR